MKIIDSVSSAWIPDDDFLLKNSIQAKASLEAVAKGSVKFSRGFTLHKLQDRWTSLLYDPVVSAQASAHMVKVEPSGFNLLSKNSKLDDLKGNRKTHEKRKAGSICVQNYRTRKRIKDELLYSPDVSFFEKCNSSSTVTEGDILCTLNTEDTIDENVVEEVKHSLFHGNEHDVCQWEADDGLTSLSHLDSVHINEGKVICILNTEESIIPCNDDIFFLIHPSPSVTHQITKNSFDPLSSFADEKDDLQGLTWSQMNGPDLSSEFDSIHQHSSYTFKSDLADTKYLHPLSGQPDMIRNAGLSRPMHINSLLTGNRVLTKKGLDTSATYSELSIRTEVSSFKTIDPESMDNNPSLSDHNNSDSDGDLLYFSDIEDLILQLDLESAQGSCIISEVARHQYNYSNRTIIRLENTTRSSLIRSMSSLGAFAIFYSRHFHYYIKKTEVTIGRSTDDTDVDIDLQKEGHGNMISSCQATIKMETDGSFTLKNIGKSSISINGNSIAHRQVAALGSSCLIEISGMNFMFEINDVMKKSQVSRLDDLKGNEKTREKRNRGSICIQNYPSSTFNSFSFELKQDSANSSTVTEGDILCSLNTEDTMDDIPDSQLLDSPENVLEDSLLLLATPRIECDEESKDSSFHGDEQDICHWEADVAVTSKSHLNSVKLSEGKFICILNTEDPEIPCNDDIFLHIHQSSVTSQITTDSIDPLFSSADLYYNFDSSQPHVGYTFRSELFDSRCLHPLFGQPDKITNPVLTVKWEQGLDTSATYCDIPSRTEDESMDNYPSISDHNNSESDDDLPYFSDIEALIHRIDLEYVEESYITSEVERHQYNYSKRTITRLEQTALSSLQSTMSSLGALAVFYSRCFNYYIKKTEVTVGRSTKDTDVDIDLRKVGHANVISRLQATIKMEIDGSFTLKNIGKSSISMNGNSIAHGQVAALGPGCLIEISGMKFMFEINERYVRRYLDNIIKENQGASRTFNWSPEGEP